MLLYPWLGIHNSNIKGFQIRYYAIFHLGGLRKCGRSKVEVWRKNHFGFNPIVYFVKSPIQVTHKSIFWIPPTLICLSFAASNARRINIISFESPWWYWIGEFLMEIIAGIGSKWFYISSVAYAVRGYYFSASNISMYIVVCLCNNLHFFPGTSLPQTSYVKVSPLKCSMFNRL